MSETMGDDDHPQQRGDGSTRRAATVVSPKRAIAHRYDIYSDPLTHDKLTDKLCNPSHPGGENIPILLRASYCSVCFLSACLTGTHRLTVGILHVLYVIAKELGRPYFNRFSISLLLCRSKQHIGNCAPIILQLKLDKDGRCCRSCHIECS